MTYRRPQQGHSFGRITYNCKCFSQTSRNWIVTVIMSISQQAIQSVLLDLLQPFELSHMLSRAY